MERTAEEIIGYCIYCLDEIQGNEPYVVKYDDLHHLDCYHLEFPDNIGGYCEQATVRSNN